MSVTLHERGRMQEFRKKGAKMSVKAMTMTFVSRWSVEGPSLEGVWGLPQKNLENLDAFSCNLTYILVAADK